MPSDDRRKAPGSYGTGGRLQGASKVEGSRRLVTIKQLVRRPNYGWLTESALRHLLFAAKPRQNSRGEELPSNGLATAIIRIGRKVLLDLDEFDAWIDAQQEDRP